VDSRSYVLTLSCEDRPGIVAAITTELAALGGNIAESNQFWDRQTGRFFMRIAFTVPDGVERAALDHALAPAIERFQMKTALIDASRKPKIVIMVSKFDHALLHLLYQIKVGWLSAEVVAIVSNHEDSRRTAENEGIRYEYWPVTKDTKAEQEERVLQLVKDTGADLVVLARYMQVLSEGMCEKLAGRVINIHHSFLPGFKGARPYEQAHARGVKLIGATAHFATSDLDEGPIIEQALERVDHAYSPEQLLSTGRSVECLALSRALRFVLEHRVFINGLRTVVLR